MKEYQDWLQKQEWLDYLRIEFTDAYLDERKKIKQLKQSIFILYRQFQQIEDMKNFQKLIILDENKKIILNLQPLTKFFICKLSAENIQKVIQLIEQLVGQNSKSEGVVMVNSFFQKNSSHFPNQETRKKLNACQKKIQDELNNIVNSTQSESKFYSTIKNVYQMKKFQKLMNRLPESQVKRQEQDLLSYDVENLKKQLLKKNKLLQKKQRELDKMNEIIKKREKDIAEIQNKVAQKNIQDNQLRIKIQKLENIIKNQAEKFKKIKKEQQKLTIQNSKYRLQIQQINKSMNSQRKRLQQCNQILRIKMEKYERIQKQMDEKIFKLQQLNEQISQREEKKNSMQKIILEFDAQKQKYEQLQKQIRIQEDIFDSFIEKNPCCICLDEPAKFVNIVCGHLCQCEKSVQEYSNKCPFCKAQGQHVRIFFPSFKNSEK